MNTIEQDREELLSAAKRAVSCLADYNGCGYIERGIALSVQDQLFKAIARAEPAYYAIDPAYRTNQIRGLVRA